MTNLLIIISKHLSINGKEYPSFKPSKGSAIRNHFLVRSNIPSFGKFTILAYGHHKYILEVKENLLIKLNRPVLNKNISSAKLFPFNNK